MNSIVSIVAALAVSAPLAAYATDAVAPTPVEIWQAAPETVFAAQDIDLAEFLWLARPVVVFADSDSDPRFQQQMTLLDALVEELVVRDVLIVTDTDPAEMSDTRKDLRPRGFMLALIAKDGTVSLRKPFPWDVRELSRAIDKMPLRQQEVRDRR